MANTLWSFDRSECNRVKSSISLIKPSYKVPLSFLDHINSNMLLFFFQKQKELLQCKSSSRFGKKWLENVTTF